MEAEKDTLSELKVERDWPLERAKEFALALGKKPDPMAEAPELIEEA